MATHDTARGSVECVCAAQNPEPRPGMPGARILPLKGVGKRNAAAALGLVLQPPCPCTRQRCAGWVPSFRVTSRPDPWSSLPSRTMIVPIEIQILDPQLQTLTDPHARSIQKLGEQTMLAFQKTEDANHFIRGQHHRQAPRRPRSSDLLKPWADPCTAPAVEEQQGRQCLTMRGDRNLALVRQPGQKCLDFAAAKVAG